MPVDSEGLAARYRAATLNSGSKSVLVSRIAGSEQEQDLQSNPASGGFARIRHFHRRCSTGWPDNPLPIDPAAIRSHGNKHVRLRFRGGTRCKPRQS